MCIEMLGAIARPNRIDTSDDLILKPDGMKEPPMNVFCPRCECISQAVYRQSYKTLVCCFFPFPPAEYQDPFLSCSRCGYVLDKLPQKACSKCRVVTPFTSEFCPKCGNKKSGLRDAGQEKPSPSKEEKGGSS